jgi:hypothetical protein
VAVSSRIPTIYSDDHAAAIIFLKGLQSAVRKEAGTPLTAWEVTCIEAVEKVSGETLLEPLETTAREAIEPGVRAARHAVRGVGGQFIPACTSEHRAEGQFGHTT